MRQSLFEEFYNHYVYTFEASFFGSLRQNEKRHFTPTDYKNLGVSICRALHKELQKEIKIEESKLPAGSLKTESDSPSKQLALSSPNPAHLTKAQLEQLKQQQQQAELQQLQAEEDMQSLGSDSDPSEDELSKKEMKSLNKKMTRQQVPNALSQQNIGYLDKSNGSLSGPGNAYNCSNGKQLQAMTPSNAPSAQMFAGSQNTQEKYSYNPKTAKFQQDISCQTVDSFDFSQLNNFFGDHLLIDTDAVSQASPLKEDRSQ